MTGDLVGEHRFDGPETMPPIWWTPQEADEFVAGLHVAQRAGATGVLPVMTRCLTCPLCETVVRVPLMPAGEESYVLPPHRPTLNVNLCTVTEVKITLGYRPCSLTELATAPPSVPPEEDARKFR